MNRIHEELTFDPQAMTVSTPVMTVFELKRGVCQDFAHLMLLCLCSIALPRYVSGIPLRGVLLGGGEHELDIAVTFAPEADYDTVFGAAR